MTGRSGRRGDRAGQPGRGEPRSGCAEFGDGEHLPGVVRRTGMRPRIAVIGSGPGGLAFARVPGAGPAPDDNEGLRSSLPARFDGWAAPVLELLRRGTDFAHRPLSALPASHTWAHAPGVTPLGDAAHLMPPLGAGANGCGRGPAGGRTSRCQVGGHHAVRPGPPREPGPLPGPHRLRRGPMGPGPFLRMTSRSRPADGHLGGRGTPVTAERFYAPAKLSVVEAWVPRNRRRLTRRTTVRVRTVARAMNTKAFE